MFPRFSFRGETTGWASDNCGVFPSLGSVLLRGQESPGTLVREGQSAPTVSTNKGRFPTIFHIALGFRVFEIQSSTLISFIYSHREFGCVFAGSKNCSVGTERGGSEGKQAIGN